MPRICCTRFIKLWAPAQATPSPSVAAVRKASKRDKRSSSPPQSRPRSETSSIRVVSQGSIFAVGSFTKPSPCKSGRYKNGGKAILSPSAEAVLIFARVDKIEGTQGRMFTR